MRDETEWTETVTAGWNRLVGVNPDHALDAWFSFAPPTNRPPLFGDGTAARRIAQVLSHDAVLLFVPREDRESMMGEQLPALEMEASL